MFRFFYIQLDKVTNLVGQCQGLFLIYHGFIDRLSLYYFISKELLQFLYLLYKFIYFYNLQGVISGARNITKRFKTHLQILALISQDRETFIVSETELFIVNLVNVSQLIQLSYKYNVYIRIYCSIIAFIRFIQPSVSR